MEYEKLQPKKDFPLVVISIPDIQKRERLLLIDFKTIHHISLSVTDLEQSGHFYGAILGLEEINRPDFDFPGAWYKIGDQQLHLIVYQDSKTLEIIVRWKQRMANLQ